MKLRTFERFTPEDICPICGTNDDKECFLMPIDGTGDGHICEAQPVHADCMRDYAEKFRISKRAGVIYFRLHAATEAKEEQSDES